MSASRSLLRRLGGGAVTLAVLTLGIAGGLLLGSPASAAGSGDIEVKLPTDADFSNFTAAPLLDISDLAPGGAVAGTVQIRDASDVSGANGITDRLSLQMINVTASDDCDVAAACTGSGAALARALSFAVHVTSDPSGADLHQSTETVSSLSTGIPLAVGLTNGRAVTLTLSASLPAGTGSTVAYGRLKFDLALSLAPVGGNAAAGSGSGGNSGNGLPGAAADGDASGSTPDVVEVLGTSRVAAAKPGGAGRPGNPDEPGQGSVLVLGQHGGSLSYTGLPLYVMLATGAAVLLAGIALLIAARPRKRRVARSPAN